MAHQAKKFNIYFQRRRRLAGESADTNLELDKIKDDIPSKEDLVESLECYPQSEWKTLGKKLGINNDAMKKFQEASTEDDTRMESMLRYWLDDSPHPTWGNFEKVMNSIGYQMEIDCLMHCSGSKTWAESWTNSSDSETESDLENDEETSYEFLLPSKMSDEIPGAKLSGADIPQTVTLAQVDKEIATKFDQLFTNGLYLKPEIINAIFKVDGVKAAAIGRSATGPRPCIRITHDPSKDDVIQKVVDSLHQILLKTWNIEKETIQHMVEVSEPLLPTLLELENGDNKDKAASEHITPGDRLDLIHDDQSLGSGNITCFVKANVEAETMKISRQCEVHIPLTCFHCVLPPIDIPPIENQAVLESPEFPQDIPVVKAKHHVGQVCSLINATISPKGLKVALKDNSPMIRVPWKPGTPLQPLTGQFGLIGKSSANNTFQIVLVEESTLREHINRQQPVDPSISPAHIHPCNLDIGACSIFPVREGILCCSFAEAFSAQANNSPTAPSWLPPPRSSDLYNAEVVTFTNNAGKIQMTPLAPHLEEQSQTLSISGQHLTFPFFRWKIPEEAITVLGADRAKADPLIYSGSPVFLHDKSSNSFRFLGGLYTRASAYDATFALDAIRPNICLAVSKHLQKVLQVEIKETKEKEERLRRQRPLEQCRKERQQLEVLKKNLQRYCRLIRRKEKEGKLPPPSNELFHDQEVLSPNEEYSRFRFSFKICIEGHEDSCESEATHSPGATAAPAQAHASPR